MNDIILIALEQEAPNMASWDNVFFTGVGKVNAGITAGRLIDLNQILIDSTSYHVVQSF